jgi:tetratricopeptide (TPR) repeat protein
VLYLDNLESWQVGPKDSEAEDNAEAIGEWASEDLGRLWESLTDLAQQVEHLFVLASCRYRTPSFAGALLSVSPLSPDALFRLMSWFPALRRLSLASRARLVERLAGHPRAVEYADDLLSRALAEREDRYGPWEEVDSEREWVVLVDPALPKVEKRLQANLLLAVIWGRVLRDRERRMLYRMTLLRRPWQWPLMVVLGEEGDGNEEAFATAERLRRTSLLEQILLFGQVEDGKLNAVRHFALHSTTVRFVREQFGQAEALEKATHRRLGDYLEAEAERLRSTEALEAGFHLFQAGEYDRAYELLGLASDWLQEHGRVREGLRLLEPFLDEQVSRGMAPAHIGRLFGTLSGAHHRMGEFEKSIQYSGQQLVVVREIRDRLGEGHALGGLCLAYAGLGRIEQSIDCAKQALEIAREVKNRRGEVNALASLGFGLVLQGELMEAIDCYEQGLALARAAEDRWGESSCLGDLGAIHARLDHLDEAIECFERQLLIAREIGDRRGEGKALGNLGVVHRDLGELGKAIQYYGWRLEIAREIGDRQGEGTVLGNLGIAFASLGEIDQAMAFLEQSLAIGQAIKSPEIVQCASKALELVRSAS